MNRDYKCRYGNSCSVGRNPINVKQVCQACRFNHCLKAGMKVECECVCVCVCVLCVCVCVCVCCVCV